MKYINRIKLWYKGLAKADQKTATMAAAAVVFIVFVITVTTCSK